MVVLRPVAAQTNVKIYLYETSRWELINSCDTWQVFFCCSNWHEWNLYLSQCDRWRTGSTQSKIWQTHTSRLCRLGQLYNVQIQWATMRHHDGFQQLSLLSAGVKRLSFKTEARWCTANRGNVREAFFSDMRQHCEHQQVWQIAIVSWPL